MILHEFMRPAEMFSFYGQKQFLYHQYLTVTGAMLEILALQKFKHLRTTETLIEKELLLNFS